MTQLRIPVSEHDWREALMEFPGVALVDIFTDKDAPFVVACVVYGGDEKSIREYIEYNKPVHMMWAVSVRPARWYQRVWGFILHWK